MPARIPAGRWVNGCQESRDALIEARLREHPEWADNLIANKLGCSDHTVKAVREELEATAQIAQSDR